MDIQLIKKLVQIVNDGNVGKLKINEGDFKIEITHKDFVAQQNITSALPTVVSNANPISIENNKFNEVKAETPIASKAQVVKAPMIGTFYRSAGPDKEAFVKVGDVVKKGDVLCIIEAMKLFNEIQSDISGKIVKVMVDNAQAVEYDQALFLIE
jgi:acetyl-CoA carboxylase biotin carboxyl carrier protein